MKRPRSFWLGLFALILLGAGTAHLVRSAAPRALRCPPDQVRLDEHGVAHCSPDGSGAKPSAAQALTLGAKLDLNRATEADLSLASGVGPKLARQLVEARARSGGFHSWDEVDKVVGVGDAKLRALQAVAEIR